MVISPLYRPRTPLAPRNQSDRGLFTKARLLKSLQISGAQDGDDATILENLGYARIAVSKVLRQDKKLTQELANENEFFEMSSAKEKKSLSTCCEIWQGKTLGLIYSENNTFIVF
jgi:hypothetical protein